LKAVNELEMPDQGLLQAQLAQANERLESLDEKLRAVDAEMDSLSDERRRYELLRDACDALDGLSELGASDLFWGEQVKAEKGDGFVRSVRKRMEGFQNRLSAIDKRRKGLVAEISKEQDAAELLHDDLFDAQQQEERRKLEWIVEREISALPARKQIMPWATGQEDDQRFRKSLGVSLLVSILLGLLVPLIDLPLPEAWEPLDVPERLARLVEEKRIPPPAVIEEKVVDVPEPEPEPEPVDEPLTPTDQPVLANDPTPKSTPQKAKKEKPQSKGILAFREKFSNMAASKTSPRLGADARISSAGEKAPGRPQRAMVTTQAPGSSGGINLAAMSRDVGGGGAGGQIGGVQLTRAASTIGGSGGQDRPLSSGAGAGRTDEEIQIVFDRHKAALYRLYNRELRKNPTLQGQMVLRIRIEPDGSVSLCDLQGTDMDAPNLSAQVLGRVRTFDFGAKEVPTVTILYPIDFLPAT
jgi:hypothetical protein